MCLRLRWPVVNASQRLMEAWRLQGCHPPRASLWTGRYVLELSLVVEVRLVRRIRKPLGDGDLTDFPSDRCSHADEMSRRKAA